MQISGFARAGGVGTVAYQAEALGGILAHLVFQDLTGGIHGEGIHKFNVSGNLVPGHAGADVVCHFLHGYGAGFLQNDALITWISCTDHVADHTRIT